MLLLFNHFISQFNSKHLFPRMLHLQFVSDKAGAGKL